MGNGDVDKLVWGAKQCTAYIFLLADPSPLLDQAEYAAHDAWDYSGRWGYKIRSLTVFSLLFLFKKGEWPKDNTDFV